MISAGLTAGKQKGRICAAVEMICPYCNGDGRRMNGSKPTFGGDPECLRLGGDDLAEVRPYSWSAFMDEMLSGVTETAA